MAKITVSAAVPQRRKLMGADPTGETWVEIMPPDRSKTLSRGSLLSRQFNFVNSQGFFVTGIDFNSVDLAHQEIWLTYNSSNLDVDIEDADGNVKNIRFKDKSDITYQEFMENLMGLPDHIINEWHAMVLDVVPGWRNPF